jgi:hypothetical protein
MSKPIGLNVAADGRHAASWVRRTGANGIRIVMTPDYSLRALFGRYRRAGQAVLGVYARESQVPGSSHEQSMSEYMGYYGSRLDYIEIMNESDLDSPSSWTMPPDEFEALGWSLHNVVRSYRSDLPIIAGGMASGQVSYLDGVNLDWCNYVGVHPYAKNATPDDDLPDIEPLAAQYVSATGKDVAITEWGWWGDETRGEYEVRDVVYWAQRTPYVAGYWHFCASDDMVPPFGLYREDYSPKPAAYAFRDAAN